MSSYRHGDREPDLDLSSAKRRRICSEGNPPPSLIGKLGDDVLVEILIRGFLNPRFACRSKLVCRRWSSLISSPCFNSRFVSHQQSRSAELAVPSSIWSFLPLPDEIRPFSRVLDSFKDLQLCGFAGFDVKTNGELARSYFICNPFTKEWTALPLAPEKEYTELVARLVCEPRISKKLDLGDGHAAFVYSEYRFRVVFIYQLGSSAKLDVFCSESGKWSKEALVLHGYRTMAQANAKSWGGKLFWAYSSLRQDGILEFNPFRLHLPPTLITVDALFKGPASSWGLSVSHGALHIIQLETEAAPGCSRNALIVWRLEDDGRSWRRQYEVLLKTTWPNHVSRFIGLDLHPEKPETALLTFSDYNGTILSCDLRSGDLKHLTLGRANEPGWMMFQPRVSCWPTPVPSYKELRGLYDGSYSNWIQQRSGEAITHSVTEQCLPIDAVGQLGHQREDNISQIVIDAYGLEGVRQNVHNLQAELEWINNAIIHKQANTVSAETTKDLKFLHLSKHLCTKQLQVGMILQEAISRRHRNLPVYPMNIGIPGGGGELPFPAAAGDHVDGGH